MEKDEKYMSGIFIFWITLCILCIFWACNTSCSSTKIPYKQAKKEWYCPPKKEYKPKSYKGNSFIHHAGSRIKSGGK